MMMKKEAFKTMSWSWKELLLLLLVAFVVVPIFIETQLHALLFSRFQDSLYAGTSTGLAMAIVFTLAVYFLAIKPHRLGWKEVGIRAFSRGYWTRIVMWTLALIVASGVILTVMDLLNISWENAKTKSIKTDMTWVTFLIGFVSSAVVSPVYEEIFYRGFLYKWMRINWGVSAGILISSAIFTAAHIPTYNTLPVNFITGAVFAWTYEKTGSIFPAMIIHGTFNGVAVILTALA
ncbi:CPBP family intramembrane glutamic endopeptidase [Paenibacillus puldeungensis]|uniref:CPBP family intramembrane glutamic endopeptidase n=1 Tax=Paenibacillus puldeungensis TaxID=696536 RepID=A0ABW3RX66_9BACL